MGVSGELDEGGAGGASLAGYEYQIDVSVWLALDLVLVTKQTSELVLEPASQEDIEAELHEVEPGRVVSRVPISGYTLVVQAKRRGGDAWTPAGLRALVRHGSEDRVSAAKRLEDPMVRYLLVTSAGLNGDARRLGVRHVGNWPKADSMPGSIAEALPDGAAGRMAVIGNEDDERLGTDVNRLLTEGCRVPNANLKACRRELREEARARVSGAGGGRWHRGELERVIQKHDGYLASSPELGHYVHPTNWADLRAAMSARHAAMIIGQSGTGKTLATRMLHDELRREIPGLTRVPIRLGPHELRDDVTPGPVLYDIEDPWGRFDFDPRSRPWNDQLAQFFANATSDRMIIATSRLDVAQASRALEGIRPWLVPLEAEHYGTAERARLYRSRIDELSRELRPLARSAEREVLDQLGTPLEIQKFFDAMRSPDLEGSKNLPGLIASAIGRAHQDAIEGTVVNQIEERCDVEAAAVIWALLKVAGKLSRSVLRDLEDGMACLDPAMDRGVSPLVDFFVAARNLRQGDGGVVTYYHPRVEAGIEQALRANRLVARRTLGRLIDLLVSPDGSDKEWGAGTAARLLAGVPEDFGVKPSQAGAAKIDAWLDARLAEGGREFKDNLKLAAAAGSRDSNGAEVARYLEHRPDSDFGGFLAWGRPKQPDSWYADRRADPATKPLVEAFVREVLTTDRVHYPEGFAAELERLAPNLSGAFLDAAARAIRLGYVESADAIAEGALSDLDGFESIVDAAVKVLTPTQEDQRRAAETRLVIENRVYGDDYGQQLAEDDDGHTAIEFLSAYVRHLRAANGWRGIARHRHREHLLPYWLRMLAVEAEGMPLDQNEVSGAFQVGHDGEHEEDLWPVVSTAWNAEFLPALRARIAEGHPRADVDQAALTCLIEQAPGELAAIGQDLLARGDENRLVEIATGLARLRHWHPRDKKRHVEAAVAAAAVLPAPFAELVDAELALAAGKVPMLSEAACRRVAGVADASEWVRRFRVAVSAHASLPVAADVRWLLANSDDADAAVLAIEAAIRDGMAAEVEAALHHRFARVAARALTAMGGAAPTPLPALILAKAADRGSPVRKALAALLKVRPDPAHVPTLLGLAKDTWSRDSGNYGHNDVFPIARTAVDALGDLAPLASADADELFAIAIGTSDPDVRERVLRLLARTGGASMQDRLFELAVRPGRTAARRAAADALFQAADVAVPEVVAKITLQLLVTRIEPVATALALLLACRGDLADVRAVAEELATRTKRRVLVLLLVWLVRHREGEVAGEEVAREMAAMLPAGHPGVAWALGAAIDDPTDALIADLGDYAICAQVLFYMRLEMN